MASRLELKAIFLVLSYCLLNTQVVDATTATITSDPAYASLRPCAQDCYYYGAFKGPDSKLSLTVHLSMTEDNLAEHDRRCCSYRSLPPLLTTIRTTDLADHIDCDMRNIENECICRGDLVSTHRCSRPEPRPCLPHKCFACVSNKTLPLSISNSGAWLTP
jgi:hypothetical protein